MSLGQVIALHLPYLRRYGRAISGSQQAGDALVDLRNFKTKVDAGADVGGPRPRPSDRPARRRGAACAP